MRNIHLNDYYSKYFGYKDSNFILFHCNFTINLLYDMRWRTSFFGYSLTSQ